jgi:hypothetical protein
VAAVADTLLKGLKYSVAEKVYIFYDWVTVGLSRGTLLPELNHSMTFALFYSK